MTEGYKLHWDLKSSEIYNHASFGATPVGVQDYAERIRARFNRAREEFYNDIYLQALPGQLSAVAGFVHADANDLVMVDNVTEGFNSVIKSLSLGPGDEVLITNRMYPNYPPVLEELSRRQGFEIVTADIPAFPSGRDEVIDAILSRTSEKTRLTIIDHVISLALVLPVKEIVSALQKRGIDCFVDGAQAIGQVPVDINDIGAAYYAGNHHKWLCAPVGSGFLHVCKDKQGPIVPAVGSGAAKTDKPFQERFGWTGTKDVTPRLCVEKTIDYMARLHPQGWPGICERNHALALQVRDIFVDKLGIDKPCPDEMIGAMFTLPLGALELPSEIDALPAHLRVAKLTQERAGVSAYAFPHEGHYLLRVSAHLYNEARDYEMLADAVADIVRDYGPQLPQPQPAPAADM
jgi:isopenicillin-N epimerase